jgi:hypothetical protein
MQRKEMAMERTFVDTGHRAGTHPESGSVCDITRPAGRSGDLERGRELLQGAVQRAAVAIGDGIQHRTDEVIAFTRRQPVGALTAAAGVGLLVGLGVAMGWRPRPSSRLSFFGRPAQQSWRTLFRLG